jgi:hypothetical protein
MHRELTKVLQQLELQAMLGFQPFFVFLSKLMMNLKLMLFVK